jgi:CHAD domain-containing protein
LRVALRRLRSALTLFGKVLPPETLAWLKAETKWAADGLGPARDWDVFCTEMLPPVAAALPDAEDLGVLAAAAEAERAAGADRVRATLADPRYATLVLALGRWIEERGWRGPDPGEDAAALAARLDVLDAPVVATADRLLAKRHKAMLKKGRHFARLSPAARHEVRIAAKKLRYAAEFFRSLYKPKKASAHIRSLAALQDDLGHLNDVATAGDLLARLRANAPTSGKRARAVAHGAGIVLGWYARAADAAEPDMIADWQAYADARPFWHKTKG